MSDAPRQVYESLGGLDAELYALARLYLEFWDALPGPSDPDNQHAQELTSELEEKCIEIIDAYGRKTPRLKNEAGHLVSLPTGDVHISWKPPELWDMRQHKLVEDGDNLIEKLGIVTLKYTPSENGIPGIPAIHSPEPERVVQTNYRPSGFPKWGRPSIAEKLLGPRGNDKYVAQPKTPGTGWVLRRKYRFRNYDMEGYLMNNNKWLECDIAPIRTQRRDHPLHSDFRHFIDGQSTAQVGPKVLSEDQARTLADEKNRGYIKVHWKRIVGKTWNFAISIISIAALAIAIWQACS